MNELISIVIPTKNRTKSLKAVLMSYLKQKLVKEIIIVDDGDGIDTELYIKSISRKENKIRYIRNLTNRGSPGSRNIGINLSTGEYVFFGEDDAELDTDHLSILLKHLKKNKAHIAAGRIIYMSPSESMENAICRANNSKRFPVDKKLFLVYYSTWMENDIQLPISHALMLINKNVFKKVMYDENYKINFWREETDFQLNAARNGFKLIYCPHTNIYHKTTNDKGGAHSSNKLTYEFWVIRNNIYFINKNQQYIKEQFNIGRTCHLIRFISYRIIVNLKKVLNLFIKIFILLRKLLRKLLKESFK